MLALSRLRAATSPLRRRVRPALEILEDRLTPAGPTVAYAVDTDWGSGLQGKITIDNSQSATPLVNWKLEFNATANLSSIWDAQIVSHVGAHYVVSGAFWNNTIAAGSRLSFGFIANPGGAAATPTQFILNGVRLDGTTPPPPPPPVVPGISVADASVTEGNSGSSIASFLVSLSQATTAPVTVSYATANGTATAGSDFQSKTGTLTFGPGETQKTITVNITGDTTVESNETFQVVLANPVNGTLADGSATGTIVNDDTAPPPPPPPPPTSSGSASFRVTDDWGSGFGGEITVTNTGSGTLTDWRLEFDFAGQISSIWNASIASRTGNHYVIKNVGWNGTLAAGASASFGFVGNPGGVTVGPTNFVLSGAGTTNPNNPSNPGNTLPDAPAWPAQHFAPYVDMTLYPTYNLVSAAQNQGIKFFTLAFIVADPQGQPAWGGYSEYRVNGGEYDTLMKQQIAGVRNLGGDVMVSFGGASNHELAEVITDVEALKAAYRSVIDAYKLTHIDFDIEGGASANKAAIDRRSQAIAALQQEAAAAGKTLSVWFTLPVLPTGLTPDGLYSVQSAVRYGVNIAGVNIMAMDYGGSAAPNPQGRMGDYAIQAATSLHSQLAAVYGAAKTDAQLWAMVGVTPMIGVNDVITEVFDQQEARELLAFAEAKGIGRLSMWSLNRDRQNPNGALLYPETTSSSIVQQPFEFSLLFASFTG